MSVAAVPGNPFVGPTPKAQCRMASLVNGFGLSIFSSFDFAGPLSLDIAAGVLKIGGHAANGVCFRTLI